MWLKSTLVWAMLTMTATTAVGACLLYVSFRDIGKEMEQSNKDFNRRLDELTSSLREVRDELRMMSGEFIRVRQATTWIEMARTANKSKYPEIVWPDLPK